MASIPGSSLLDRIGTLVMREPGDRAQLVALLRSAARRSLLDADALSMIEGVLQVSELQASDIMVPRAQMDVIDSREAPDRFLARMVDAGHSRYPVIGDSIDDVIGILLAKDLLRCFAGKSPFDLRSLVRPALFIPETNRLDMLLKEFRAQRQHMAIVVDEFGGVAGLVTIEDVIEQIVGEIRDEHDVVDDALEVLPDGPERFRVRGLLPLDRFDAAFGTHHAAEGFDTVGGLVLARFGRPPRRGEVLDLDGLRVRVLRADARRVHLLQVERTAAPPASAQVPLDTRPA